MNFTGKFEAMIYC